MAQSIDLEGNQLHRALDSSSLAISYSRKTELDHFKYSKMNALIAKSEVGQQENEYAAGFQSMFLRCRSPLCLQEGKKENIRL